MAPQRKSGGNSGGKNPHITKRGRFNPNTNVPVSHAGCVVTARAKEDRERDKVTRFVFVKSGFSK